MKDGAGTYEKLGIVIGRSTSLRFSFLISAELRRNDYVMVHAGTGRVIGVVDTIENISDLNAQKAFELMNGQETCYREHGVAHVAAVGIIQGEKVEMPEFPVEGGSPVYRATERDIRQVLGIADSGAFVGKLHGTDISATLNLEDLVQRHMCILAKTGAGKSYLAGVLIEELLKNSITVLVIDPHGEYCTLTEPADEAWSKYAAHVRLFAVDPSINSTSSKISFTLSNFKSAELLSATALSGNKSAELLLSKWMNEHGEDVNPEDLLKAETDDAIGLRLKEELESLFSQGAFAARGTPVSEILSEGRTSVLSFKGLPPEQQSLLTCRLLTALFEMRKRGKVAPLVVVLEEAHNFCPQQGAVSSSRIIRTVAAEGRKFGLWLLVITQRPAKVDKNVLSQCNTQFILRVTNKNDLSAIANSVEGLTPGLLDEIPVLGTGVAVVSGGGLPFPLIVDVRPRESRHGGESPGLFEKAEPDRQEVES